MRIEFDLPDWELQTWLIIIALVYCAISWLVLGPIIARHVYVDGKKSCDAYDCAAMFWIFAPVAVAVFVVYWIFWILISPLYNRVFK